MSKDEQIEDMNQLCKKYGFEELGYYDYCCFDAFELSIIEDLYQTAKLFQLLQVCKGNTITIASIISQPQKGMIKGTEYKASIEYKYLIEYLFSDMDKRLYNACLPFNKVLSDHSIDITDLKADDLNSIIHMTSKLRTIYKCTKNAKLGWHLYNMHKEFTEAGYYPEDSTKTKQYCFLYDFCVVVGKANYIGEGFSGDIGKDKYTQVKNWITAYKNQIINKHRNSKT